MSLSDIPAVVAYRVLPFLAYASIARGLPLSRRVTMLAFFVAMGMLALYANSDLSEVLVRGPAALVYFAGISLAAYELKLRIPPGVIGNIALLLFCAATYVLVPALVYPVPVVVATVAFGWQAMLSAYSYCVDSRAETCPSSRKDCLFFILVNPALVYAERGRDLEKVHPTWPALARIGLGMGAWVAQVGLQTALWRALPGLRVAGYSWFLVACGGTAFAFYFAHSGLASIQIGLPKLAGYEVPERYALPFLSQSPEEFWRRWNVYLGSWVKRYVFFPTALAARRSTTSILALGGSVIAVVLAFAAVGVLHDYTRWVLGMTTQSGFEPAPKATWVFLIFGGVVVVWHAAVAGWRRFAGAALGRVCGGFAGRVLSVIAFLHVAFVMVWILLSTGLLF